ncbi:MAG TPA: hypothetical protein VIY90_22920 [Steroidobacteraceae bacterium]
MTQWTWGAGNGSSSSPATAASAGTAPYASEKLQEIEVTARRLELEKRVANFVNQIAATENGDEGLARWEVPAVCPLVSGLSRQDGEFILGRLSEVARIAAVPLAGEHCRPNLYILVTTQPEDLLKGMEKRNRAYTFGVDASSYPPVETPANMVDEFIRTPRPVRVWHNITEKDAWGQPLTYCQSQMVLPPPPLCTETSIINPAACDPNRYYRCGPAIAGGSHLVLNSMWMFSRVFVIVDQTRLRGVTLRQLADYVAMSGFAKLKPGARLGDAPTILKLFDAASQPAPAGMTEWDQSFLKSLYATEQKSKLQRSQIVHQMARGMAP